MERGKSITKTTVRVIGHYEVEETPFGRSYKWQQAYVTLKCDCGVELTLSDASTTGVCSRCGAEHSDFVTDLEKREELLGHEVRYPWYYDAQEQARQHLKDEAAHPENSPWRYNDITSRGADDDRNVQ